MSVNANYHDGLRDESRNWRVGHSMNANNVILNVCILDWCFNHNQTKRKNLLEWMAKYQRDGSEPFTETPKKKG